MNLERTLKSPLLFATVTLLLATFYSWPRRWTLSGAPILHFLFLLGESYDYRVLSNIHLWGLFSTLNLLYAICSTSWLLYWVYTGVCYPAIGLVSLIQFEAVGDVARKSLRTFIKQLHFIDDKIAFFDIPALEIDTDVDGLLVIRGVTFSLSTLSFVAHGVEVGIKLSDDMELAIQTPEVRVKLFRGIEIDDCFANLKGGEYEMTFESLDEQSKDADGDAVFVEGTPLLKKASQERDIYRRSLEGRRSSRPRAKEEGLEEVKMMDAFTAGSPPERVGSPKEGLKNMKKISTMNEEASGRYEMMMEYIENTDTIYEARHHIMKLANDAEDNECSFDNKDDNALRAAICSLLHQEPSVPHPPKMSVKVSTIKNSSSLRVKRFQHRFPMLLRLLLNPLSYFHPVKISAVTATASGRWIDSLLVEKIFKTYTESDTEIRNLKRRISAWLSDANFAVELGSITGLAHVPFLPSYDINCRLIIDDVMAYRATPAHIDLKQVIRIGGADATFLVPSYLLPHHEHILPPKPSSDIIHEKERSVDEADGKPAEVREKAELEKTVKDECAVGISVHARLPACFDQSLLEFISALVKASKVVEMEKEHQDAVDTLTHWESSEDDEEPDSPTSSLNPFTSRGSSKSKAKRVHDKLGDLKQVLKGGMKRTMVQGVVNDRWIAKMVGKLTGKLESARGDIGYSGEIPVALEKYRTQSGGDWRVLEGEKLLP